METKVILSDREMPASWYNVLPDLPVPLPPVLHPGTGKPVTPDDLAPIFPMALIQQEMSAERCRQRSHLCPLELLGPIDPA